MVTVIGLLLRMSPIGVAVSTPAAFVAATIDIGRHQSRIDVVVVVAVEVASTFTGGRAAVATISIDRVSLLRCRRLVTAVAHDTLILLHLLVKLLLLHETNGSLSLLHCLRIAHSASTTVATVTGVVGVAAVGGVVVVGVVSVGVVGVGVVGVGVAVVEIGVSDR